MSSKRGHFKDRILEGVAKAIKEVQNFSCGIDCETVTITNDDRPLQKVVERLDHAFLHGLRNVTRGYWGVAKLFAHRDIIHEISKLDRLTTDLGRSRAWLYKSLNDMSLESYLRCFQENPSTMRKYYVETGMLRDKQRVMVLQTLVSGLDFVTFDLEINIAYFDLVSYIPRSASISEADDDSTTVSNDSAPTTPGTPAALQDSDCASSIASAEAFSPMEDTPQPGPKVQEMVVASLSQSKMERQHSLPQHYSEIDRAEPQLLPQAQSLPQAMAPSGQGEEQTTAGPILSKALDAVKVAEGKPVRPVSLGVLSLSNGKLSDESSTGQPAAEEGSDQGSLEVIRLSTARTKKSKQKKKSKKKEKKADRPLAEADSGLTHNASSGTLSSDCDKALDSCNLMTSDTQPGDSLSKSSSHSSLCSTSDRGSLQNDYPLPPLIKSDGNTLVITNKSTEENSAEKPKRVESDESDSPRNLPQGDEEHKQSTMLDTRLVEETNQSKEETESRTSDPESASEPILARPECQAQQSCPPEAKPRSGHGARSSLSFDETVVMTLSSPRKAPPPAERLILSGGGGGEGGEGGGAGGGRGGGGGGRGGARGGRGGGGGGRGGGGGAPLDRSLNDELNSSLSSYPAETVPSFASLFSESVPWSSASPGRPALSVPSPILSPDSAPDGQSQETSPETDNGRIMKTHSDISGSRTDGDGRASDVPRETVTVAKLESKTHEAEIQVDNNLKLYLMLEIFNKEREQFQKLIRMSTGHMEGDLQPAFILLTDQMLYVLRRGERQGQYTTQHRLAYTSLDYISVGLNYQTVHIVCTNRRKQYWLTTGDESLTRFFLSSLRGIMGHSQQSREPLSILTDATAQQITLKKWAAQQSKTERDSIRLHLYSLVHWEDLTDLSVTPDLQLYEPQISLSGHLDYKVPGHFRLGGSWRKAWFVLRNDLFSRFSRKEDSQPDLSVQLRMPQFGGCRRVRNGEHPYSFELILSDGASLVLSCDTEEKVSDWLQAICQVVAQSQAAATSPAQAPPPCQPCCAVTTSHTLLLCHEDCQTNFYRLLARAELTDIVGLTTDPLDSSYLIVEFQRECAQNPWVFYFNSAEEKAKFESLLDSAWKEHMQVDLPILPITDERVQKRCHECSALIQSSWQRSDSLMRGRIRGSIW